MDKTQKLILVNQYKILSDLARLHGDEDEEKSYYNNVELLQHGYSREYEGLFEEISDDELHKEDCDLVWDILELYSYMRSSYKQLENSSLSETDIEFNGFDGNDESKFLAYCNFIIFKLNRFCELTENKKDFNSHYRVCSKYKKMIERWTEMGKPYNMSEEQIKTILGL